MICLVAVILKLNSPSGFHIALFHYAGASLGNVTLLIIQQTTFIVKSDAAWASQPSEGCPAC
jgi:hypothetical protein